MKTILFFILLFFSVKTFSQSQSEIQKHLYGAWESSDSSYPHIIVFLDNSRMVFYQNMIQLKTGGDTLTYLWMVTTKFPELHIMGLNNSYESYWTIPYFSYPNMEVEINGKKSIVEFTSLE